MTRYVIYDGSHRFELELYTTPGHAMQVAERGVMVVDCATGVAYLGV